MRISIIDGFRGFFLIFMMVVHANEFLKTTIGKLNHHYFGWVEDAQGFVFLSGLVVGLVYGGILIRKGQPAMDKAIWRRMKTIYLHQAGLILILAIAAMAATALGLKLGYLAPYANAPAAFTLASLGLVTGSAHMGILPMYILFLLFTPFVLRWLRLGYLPAVVTGSLCLWLFAQTGLSDTAVDTMESTLNDHGYRLHLGIFFNVAGWQLIFFAGLCAGYLKAAGELDLGWMHRPGVARAFAVAACAILLLGLYDRVVFDFWISHSYSDHVLDVTDRGNLSTIYAVAFFLDLFAIVWLLVAGPQSSLPGIALGARVMTTIFTWKPLVFLGQHSLHVFSAHILCVYALELYFLNAEPGRLAANIAILLSPLPLFAAAWGHARMQATGGKPVAA